MGSRKMMAPPNPTALLLLNYENGKVLSHEVQFLIIYLAISYGGCYVIVKGSAYTRNTHPEQTTGKFIVNATQDHHSCWLDSRRTEIQRHVIGT